jgi:Ribbon-helix-helix protein, copG family
VVQEAAVSKQTQPRTEKELAAELLEHRSDEGEWAEEAVSIKRKPSLTEVVSVRIPSSDLDLIEDLADQAGESISDFIRGAIALRLHGHMMDPVLGFASGAGSDLKVSVRTILKAAGHTALPSHEEFQLDIDVPDEPPSTVTIMR